MSLYAPTWLTTTIGAASPCRLHHFFWEVRDLILLGIGAAIIAGYSSTTAAALGLVITYSGRCATNAPTRAITLESCNFENLLLHSSFFALHPPLLYAGLLFFFSWYGCAASPSRVFTSAYTILAPLLLLVGALGLSILWAFNETSWGGWWGWDISEMALLAWIAPLFVLVHRDNNTRLQLIYAPILFLFAVTLYTRAQITNHVTAHTFLTWAQFLHTYTSIFAIIISGGVLLLRTCRGWTNSELTRGFRSPHVQLVTLYLAYLSFEYYVSSNVINTFQVVIGVISLRLMRGRSVAHIGVPAIYVLLAILDLTLIGTVSYSYNNYVLNGGNLASASFVNILLLPV